MFYSKEPLEHFMWVSLNILSLKTAMLLPLTSAERVSDQCALFICPSCLLMREDLTDVTLKSCPLQVTMLKHCLAQGHFRQKHSVPHIKENRENLELHCFFPSCILICYIHIKHIRCM